MTQDSETPQESNSNTGPESPGATGASSSSSVDRRQVLQGLAGGATVAVVGSGSSAAELGQPKSDPLSGKRVYVDPALQMESTFARTASAPNPAEADLALLATKTELEQGIVYDFLNTETPVSVVGHNADLHAFDYLTEGEGNLDGIRIDSDFNEKYKESDFLNLESTSEIDAGYGFELSPNRDTNLSTLKPDGKSINICVQSRGPGQSTNSRVRGTSIIDHKTLSRIKNHLQPKVGTQNNEERENDHPHCDEGPLVCGGEYEEYGETDGNEWHKRIIAGFTEMDDGTVFWALRSLMELWPNRSPLLRKWTNENFDRYIMDANGDIDESKPDVQGDVTQYSYSMSISTGDVTANWSQTTQEARMEINHNRGRQRVEHEWRDLSKKLSQNAVFGEQFALVEDPGGVISGGALEYGFYDKMEWEREYSTQHSTKKFIGDGYWYPPNN